MTRPGDSVDDTTAGLVLAFELRDDDEVLAWWRTVREARQEAGDDVAVLVEQVRRDAAVSDRTVEVFAELVSAEGVYLVDRLLELEPWLPALFWSLREPPFGWVTTAQRDVLTSVWGAEWEAPLREQLAGLWGPDWDGHPGDHKAVWLDDLLAEWTARPAEPEPEPLAEMVSGRDAALREALEEIRRLGVTAQDLSDEQVAEMLDNAVLAELSTKGK
ncbi:hypothetical protein AB5J62_22415 [Amycolatopsis sp. cg5]|uniref:hypothetical protein n=1 Tax=Amycolatopsis sp. cg5 TaxID=3238802 RepID=UPI00352667B5